MKAEIILQALKNRHWRDVFISECKTGPTWFNSHLRKLDAWVMKRSWTQFGTIGYEIKVSRSDFKQDKKWREYLPYCHQFYFVCPWGLIQPEEIDKAAGLCWVSKNGQRIYIKKHVLQRDTELPVEILIHIIMSRTIVMRPQKLVALNAENRRLKEQLLFWKKKRGLQLELQE